VANILNVDQEFGEQREVLRIGREYTSFGEEQSGLIIDALLCPGG
jgi:hypothetical protein